jgi:hypothetical protein
MAKAQHGCMGSHTISLHGMLAQRRKISAYARCVILTYRWGKVL